MSVEPFTFGIPLVARSVAADWQLVESLLTLTLGSLAGQGDHDFRVIVAGHDRPAIEAAVAFDFLRADWPVEAVRADNLDRGRKVQAINEAVLAGGGGLLMILDADDWVDTRLVATARATIAPDEIGAVIERGFAVDFRNGRALPIPNEVFAGGFDRLCGSSVVARIDPLGRDALHRDPYAVLHEHYRFVELAREHGATCRRLDVDGAYVVNTAANHSELHGPFAEWRRSFNDAVARDGFPADDLFLSRFGLCARDLAAVMGSKNGGLSLLPRA